MTTPRAVHGSTPTPRRAEASRPLDVSGPLRAGVMAVVALGGLLAAASAIEVEQGPLGQARGLLRTEPVAIRHGDAGQIARWQVAVGSLVAPGESLVQLETRALDTVIDALKKHMRGIRIRLEALTEEVQAYAGGELQAGARSRLAIIDSQRAELEKEEVGLAVTLAMHEQNRARAAIKSPVGGRIAEIAVPEGGTFRAQATLATIVPEAGRARLEVVWPPRGTAPTVGQPVRAWPEGALWPSHVFAGVIESVEIGDGGQARTRIALDVRDSPLAEPRPREHQFRFAVQRVEQQLSLLGHFLAPLGRSPAASVPVAALGPSSTPDPSVTGVQP
jgi:multidrug efflux pump subunit AcrA (membrane-fusion protein)